MVKLKFFEMYRLSKFNKFYELLKDYCYHNENEDLYVKDTEGNYYKLPQQATVTQRDIYLFTEGIKAAKNVYFNRIKK